jgi:flagellar hook-basal body complex protein FliE
MSTPTAAANAYAALARLTNPTAGASKGAGAEAGEGNFGSVLQNALGAIVEAGQTSDRQAQAMVAGKANIVDVVTAVSETEVAVESLVAVRDKVIAAYEEIMRMPI